MGRRNNKHTKSATADKVVSSGAPPEALNAPKSSRSSTAEKHTQSFAAGGGAGASSQQQGSEGFETTSTSSYDTAASSSATDFLMFGYLVDSQEVAEKLFKALVEKDHQLRISDLDPTRTLLPLPSLKKSIREALRDFLSFQREHDLLEQNRLSTVTTFDAMQEEINRIKREMGDVLKKIVSSEEKQTELLDEQEAIFSSHKGQRTAAFLQLAEQKRQEAEAALREVYEHEVYLQAKYVSLLNEHLQADQAVMRLREQLYKALSALTKLEQESRGVGYIELPVEVPSANPRAAKPRSSSELLSLFSDPDSEEKEAKWSMFAPTDLLKSAATVSAAGGGSGDISSCSGKALSTFDQFVVNSRDSYRPLDDGPYIAFDSDGRRLYYSIISNKLFDGVPEGAEPSNKSISEQEKKIRTYVRASRFTIVTDPQGEPSYSHSDSSSASISSKKDSFESDFDFAPLPPPSTETPARQHLTPAQKIERDRKALAEMHGFSTPNVGRTREEQLSRDRFYAERQQQQTSSKKKVKAAGGGGGEGDDDDDDDDGGGRGRRQSPFPFGNFPSRGGGIPIESASGRGMQIFVSSTPPAQCTLLLKSSPESSLSLSKVVKFFDFLGDWRNLNVDVFWPLTKSVDASVKNELIDNIGDEQITFFGGLKEKFEGTEVLINKDNIHQVDESDLKSAILALAQPKDEKQMRREIVEYLKYTASSVTLSARNAGELEKISSYIRAASSRIYHFLEQLAPTLRSLLPSLINDEDEMVSSSDMSIRTEKKPSCVKMVVSILFAHEVLTPIRRLIWSEVLKQKAKKERREHHDFETLYGFLAWMLRVSTEVKKSLEPRSLTRQYVDFLQEESFKKSPLSSHHSLLTRPPQQQASGRFFGKRNVTFGSRGAHVAAIEEGYESEEKVEYEQGGHEEIEDEFEVPSFSPSAEFEEQQQDSQDVDQRESIQAVFDLLNSEGGQVQLAKSEVEEAERAMTNLIDATGLNNSALVAEMRNLHSEPCMKYFWHGTDKDRGCPESLLPIGDPKRCPRDHSLRALRLHLVQQLGRLIKAARDKHPPLLMDANSASIFREALELSRQKGLTKPSSASSSSSFQKPSSRPSALGKPSTASSGMRRQGAPSPFGSGGSSSY